MPRLRYSASTRPRARLISTPYAHDPTDPTAEGAPVATTTVHGVKYSDHLAALLLHAEANGFRIEFGGRPRGSGASLIAYAPDKTVPPITVSERGAKFNKPHYENLRRQFYAAGCPPLPADDRTTTDPEEPTMAKKTTHPTPVNHTFRSETELLAAVNGEGGPEALAGIMAGMFAKAEMGPFAELGGAVVYAVSAWARDHKEGLLSAAQAHARAAMQAEIDEALAMASDAEATVARLNKAVEAAEARETQAREDCGAALERARDAEARAAEAEAAIAPLRAFLTAK